MSLYQYKFLNSFAQITPLLSVKQGLRSFSIGEGYFGKNRGKGPPKNDNGSHKTFDKNKFIPQKFHPDGHRRTNPFGLPALSQQDCERRVIFAEQVLSILENDPTILQSIVFSDEGNFWPVTMKGNSKKKKSYNESESIPTIVWCGMTSKEVIGPYFFNSYVTESSYLKMLRKYLLPQLTCLNYPLTSTWFQHDGAPPHRSSRVLSFLQSAFENRLISYGCPIAWPPRSQDLTPLDYHFWDYLKEKIAPFQPKNTQDLRECISFEIKVVDSKLCKKVVDEFYVRLEMCLAANGQRFIIEKPM